MSLKAEKANDLVLAIKAAKQKLMGVEDKEHEAALNELRDAEEAYQDYLYSQRP